jgi:hypothetical protein
MTVYIIFPDATDGYLTSRNMNYNTAVAGSNLTADTTATYLKVGQNIAGNGEYYSHQSFLTFDTSVIADAEEIVETSINAYMGWPQNQKSVWGQQFRQFNYTSPITTAQWQTPALARTRPIIANFDHLFAAAPYQWRVTGRDTLTSISKTAATKFVVVNNRFADGYINTGVEEVWMDGSRGVNKPYLTVWTTALNTMNVVSEASTTLPDGTTISMRSNGTATPTLTLGYNTLTSSTWTSIGTVWGTFTSTVDGANSISLTSDPDGNFYVVGFKAGTTGELQAQAYIKTPGSNIWTAQTPVTQALPQGNQQTIRSISTTWVQSSMTGGDSKPVIFGNVVRGSGGNRPEFPYHVSGAGWTHDFALNPIAIKQGYGSLIFGTTPNYSAIPQAALPAVCDIITLSPTRVAQYYQRGKVASAVVGGISVTDVYNAGGFTKSSDLSYVPTGASFLVAISSDLFAQVFDEDGLKVTVRIYNANSQIVGSASIPKESFFGGVIGTQFVAYYDKVANLVRVLYIPAASVRQIDMFSVSPVTFSGTTQTALTATLGAVGSTNTSLRVSRTTDERRVLLEAANNAAGVLSTQAVYVTVGNVVPSAPALTTRPNFDATSAATFYWAFGDVNPKDSQTAYQLEISRVSDSVVVYDSGKVSSVNQFATVNANVLTNAINYRWRVRTYDVIDSVGTWSGYGTFTTSATGTLSITSPATDNLAGIETDDYTVTWSYVQSGGATQAQRRVRLIRTSDSAVLLDTTMQANTTPYYTISGMESGKEYRVEVSLVNTGAISVPVVSRLISPYYSEPMTPTIEINAREDHNEIIVVNPTPTGDRPEVVYNDIYKRRTSSTATDADFKRIAIVNTSASYKDYAVKSGTSYDYRVIGRTV